MIRSRALWLTTAGLVLAALAYATLGNAITSLRDITMEEVANVGAVGVVVAALLLIPFSIVALRYHEGDERIQFVHKTRDARFWPSLFVTTWMTRASVFGMSFILGILFLRLAFKYDVIGETAPQPAWSLALNMLASMVLLVLLALPTSFLLWTKYQILNLRYIPRNGFKEGK